MRAASYAVALLVACGPPPAGPLAAMNVVVSNVEWRVHASDAEHVEVELVVDGGVTKLGSAEATPELCAMRAAAAKVTELECGAEDFVAELQPGELVVTELVGKSQRGLRRIPIGTSIAIIVARYRIPERAGP
ncbi:hypothetical protein BH11MYX1_BH11MYX1_57250 [soil metagenome]